MNKATLKAGLAVLDDHLLRANMEFYRNNYWNARAAINDAHDQLTHLQAQLIDAPYTVTSDG